VVKRMPPPPTPPPAPTGGKEQSEGQSIKKTLILSVYVLTVFQLIEAGRIMDVGIWNVSV
jgi:hypothetical protein